jgi:hypothetical protein
MRIKTQQFKGNEYLFSLNTATWLDGYVKCRIWGGNLASILSKEEQNFIMKRTNSARKYFIGLSDRNFEGKFSWSDG